MRLKPFILILAAAAIAALLWRTAQPGERTASRPSSQQPRSEEAVRTASETPTRSAPLLVETARAPTEPSAKPPSLALRRLLDPQKIFQERLTSIGLLSTNLSRADEAALQAFLADKDDADRGQTSQTLKNALLDRLCELNPPPAWLSGSLCQLYRDHEQDVVIRDYAVQHLAALAEQMQMTSADNPGTKQTIQETLWEATGETGGSIAGTALLALARLSQESHEFDQARISEAALHLAADSTSSELSRSAAFQVCARLGASGSQPILQNVAQESESIPLRISAIGALGTLQSRAGVAPAQEVVSLLTSLEQGPEPRLKFPAQQALQRIEQAQQRAQATPPR